MLADLDTFRAGETLSFDGCKELGAVNLRGTGFASRDIEVTTMKAKIGGVLHEVEVNVTSVAGFLLAKTAAAFSRRKEKDWYDIAFVLLHNSGGGVEFAADKIIEKFGDELTGSVRIAMDDLLSNFELRSCQGPRAYAEQMYADHPELDQQVLLADAVVAVTNFHQVLFSKS